MSKGENRGRVEKRSMIKEKISTDFFNYGTYNGSEADILKRELEKNGIPVKMLYPGTNVGRETTMGAAFTAYQLMIRACDFRCAEEIRKKLNIASIEPGKPMPLPKTYEDKLGIALVYELIIFLIGLFILGKLEGSLSKPIIIGNIITNNHDRISEIWFLVFFIIFISTLALWTFKTLKDWFKKK